MRFLPLLASVLAVALAGTGCSCSENPGGYPDGSTVLPDGNVILPDGAIYRPDGGPGFDVSTDGPLMRLDGTVTVVEDGGFTYECAQVVCSGHLTECGDCADNDMDGVVDSRDPECLGPCDNTEGPQLTTGVGGEGGNSCNRDCYFDYGNGSGNDDCRWDTLCDPNEPDAVCPHEAGELGGMRCPATQSGQCLSLCRPVTPNGCDCFGCCTFDALVGRPASEGGEFVWLGSGIDEGPDGEGTCTFALLEDTTACRPCEPVADCLNDCGTCELCLGRTTLPPECTMYPDAAIPDSGMYPPPRCDMGVQACGLPGDAPCPTDYFCITGCCIPTLI